jgi:hypothetical protein
MYQSPQLQFRLMSAEAQDAAINRLLIQGCALEDIAERTGLTLADLQSRLDAWERAKSGDAPQVPVQQPPSEQPWPPAPWKRHGVRSRYLCS